MSKTALLIVIRDNTNKNTTSQTIIFEYFEGAQRAADQIEKRYSRTDVVGYVPFTVITTLLPGAA